MSSSPDTVLRGTGASAGRVTGPLFVAGESRSPAGDADHDMEAVRAAAERAALRLEELAAARRERSPAGAGGRRPRRGPPAGGGARRARRVAAGRAAAAVRRRGARAVAGGHAER